VYHSLEMVNRIVCERGKRNNATSPALAKIYLLHHWRESVTPDLTGYQSSKWVLGRTQAHWVDAGVNR
jgi:hypothetical protein